MRYFKYILKCFKENLTRFLAVIAIIALGIGFLVGLSTSSVDIRNSVNKMYDSQNVMDLNLKSTIGFTDENLEALKTKNNEVEGAYLLEPKESKHKNQKVNLRMYSYDLEHSKINELKLLEGSFPKAQNECVILEDLKTYRKMEIGDKITITYDTYVLEGLEYKLKEVREEYLVSGIVKSPIYYQQAKEFSQTGSDRLDGIFYVDSKYRDDLIYTDLFISDNSIYKRDHFSSWYLNDIKDLKKNLVNKEEQILSTSEVGLKEVFHLKAKGIIYDLLKATNPEATEEALNLLVEQFLVTNKELIDNFINDTYAKLFPSENKKLYVLGLEETQSYVALKSNTEKIDKISYIFPVFFYFIAALVSLTTFTRIVEEDRTTLGLLKSLGYSKGKILGKYLFYAIICSIFGSLLGNAMGVYLLPYVIYNAFSSVFTLPSPVYGITSIVNFVSIAAMILTLFFVTIYVVLRSLRERPAQLLQPKTPKPGKRLLIERWKAVWKKIKFKHKNMIRNVFRYKKNLVMMMIGVGGCVGLLLCAFGIRESFSNITTDQFTNNLTYDLKLTINKDTVLNLDDYEEVTDYHDIYEQNVYLFDNTTYPIRRIIADQNLNNYFNFHHGKKNYEFKENDVFIDRQLAEVFKLKVGDKIKFDDFNDQEFEITAIIDNQVDNYIFIYSDEVKLTHRNAYLVNLEDGVDSKAFAKKLHEHDINSIEIVAEVEQAFTKMLGSIGLIMVVVILCSLALAAIVIYNLTNININERIREIATLKVLGYQNKEVYGYIFREIFILTFFGILFGFLIGPLLFLFIMHNITSPGMYFYGMFNPIYYLVSFLITLGFAFLVDLMFIPKLKHIKMVESLKCVE